jgi:hypothetical protein
LRKARGSDRRSPVYSELQLKQKIHQCCNGDEIEIYNQEHYSIECGMSQQNEDISLGLQIAWAINYADGG